MDYSLTKISWTTFNYIFSSDPRTAFQQLAEQLFCFEFGQPYGIYRFYNQPYIETMPIKCGDDYIGFQAKYYDASTHLSDNTAELISSIDGAHVKYPGINKIIFYINKEPGISPKAGEIAPEYIKKVEGHGKSRGINIEWRSPNQMETMLLSSELSAIRDYFFSADGGIRKALAQINVHKNSILDSISSHIQYRDHAIHIERVQMDLDSFYQSEKSVLLIHGEGGSGKSSLIKTQLGSDLNYPVFVFRMTDLDCPGVSEFAHKFGNCTWDEILSAFDGAPLKLCVIDSAEKVFTMTHSEIFEDIFKMYQKHGWRIIFTIRTEYKDNFLNTILHTSNICEQIVQPLTAECLVSLKSDYGIPLPSNIKLRNLLCNLFYLKLFLSTAAMSESETTAEFVQNIWEQVICDYSNQQHSLHARRDQMICTLAHSNANTGTAYYTPDAITDWDAIAALEASGIIQRDDALGGYFITHDGYEEIILRHIITREYMRKENGTDFFAAIGDSLIMRKTFRLWLRELIGNSDDKTERFLLESLANEDIASVWKDDILIALMSEENIGNPHLIDSILNKNEFRLLFRALGLLTTACNVIDDSLLLQVLTQDEMRSFNSFRFTKPAGCGWRNIILYTYVNRDQIQWSPINVMLVVDVLYAWTRHNRKGQITRNAGLMALYLYETVYSKKYNHTLGEERISRICDSILNSAEEILPELTAIFEEVLAQERPQRRQRYDALCRRLLESSFNCGMMCNASPELVIRLARFFWLRNNKDIPSLYDDLDLDIAVNFGIDSNLNLDYYPTSAFQTPIFVLLQVAPIKAINFIIDFLNIATDKYRTSPLNVKYSECEDIELVFPDGERNVQTMSCRLWLMYRGTHVAPNLLTSILMALERWLYYSIPETSEDMACKICMHLLRKSHSAAITAVVTSIVTAYPEKLFPIACILLHTKEIFTQERYRFTKEFEANFFRGANPRDELFDNERIKSNKLPFRQKSLEDIILEYQINQFGRSAEDYNARLEMLYHAIDETFSPEDSLTNPERFVLYRIDLRKMTVLSTESDGEKSNKIMLVSDLPEDLKALNHESIERNEKENEYSQLYIWSHSRYNHDENQYKKYDQYEKDPMFALNRAITLTSEKDSLGNEVLLYVAAVLLTDFHAQISAEAYDTCKDIIIGYLKSVIDKPAYGAGETAASAAISALPAIMSDRGHSYSLDNPAVMLLAFICDWGNRRDIAVQTLRNYIWQFDSVLAHNLLEAFIKFKPDYDKKITAHGDMRPSNFFESNSVALELILEQQVPNSQLCFDDLSETALQTLNLLLPFSLSEITKFIPIETGKIFWVRLFSAHHHSYRNTGFRDYEQERAYLKWLGECLLSTSDEYRNNILRELLPRLAPSDNLDSLLTQIIFCQNEHADPYPFWAIWSDLYAIVAAFCESEKAATLNVQTDSMDRYYGGELDKVLTTYLLAFPWWTKGIHSWHTLRGEDSLWFKKASADFGYHPGTLYSIARVLNTVGYDTFLDYGIEWLAEIVRNNPHLRICSLEINTEYYMEEYTQRYILCKRSEIRRNSHLRKNLFDVLGFLVDRGSTCGYMLRESIC